MTRDQLTESYRRMLGDFEQVAIRRYTGTGAARPRFDWTTLARVTDFSSDELTATILQTDRKMIVLHDDLVAAQFPFPILNGPNWKVIQAGGKELQIKNVDDRTKRFQGVPIAYVIQAGG